MLPIVLFDEPTTRNQLLPFTFTRPSAMLRCGILTLAEKWVHRRAVVSVLATPYLQVKHPVELPSVSTPLLYINGALCPHTDSLKLLNDLPENTAVWQGEQLVAVCTAETRTHTQALVELARSFPVQADASALGKLLQYPWELVEENAAQIAADFRLITQNRQSAPLPDAHTVVYGAENVFLEEGVSIKASVINAEEGVVYLGKNSRVGEGSLIRGSLALCDHAELAFGAKMKGGNTIGPYARVGGEVSNSIFLGRSNKIHDGFLGNSLIGEWCNLGAATNNSNLKNTYSPVKVWNYATGNFQNTQLQFCGLFMGDYTKCGINTMFNTGTVVGVAANVFGSGFPPKFIPSFAWGGAAGFESGECDKLVALAQKVKERKYVSFTEADRSILHEIYSVTKKWRTWEMQ